jgi:hypothetical protein
MATHTIPMIVAIVSAISLGGGSASAQSTGKSRCGWVARGVYACESTYESPYSKTYTLCGSGGIDTACTTKTTRKEPPGPPSVTYGPGTTRLMP